MKMTTASGVASGVLALVLAAGCAAGPKRYDTVAVRASGQALAGQTATSIIESRQPGGIVSIQPSDRFRAVGPTFAVAVGNVGTAPWTFGPENVTASFRGRPLQVYTSEQVEARLAGQTRTLLRATERGTPGQRRDLTAGNPSVSREYTYNNYGGCPAGQGRCQIGAEDLGRGYRVDRNEREANFEDTVRAANQLTSDLRTMNQAALRPGEVKPGGVLGGLLVIEAPPTQGDIDLAITAGGKTHTFTFRATPAA